MHSKVSGFSFGHNLISGGYPIKEAIQSVQPFVDEVVVVDMESTDDTRKLLQSLNVRIIDGQWGDTAGEILANAHALHSVCNGETILHFEGDEVFDQSLLIEIKNQIEQSHNNLSVYRLQLEQNFQRCRWYPELVHRVFPKGTVEKIGHTTTNHAMTKHIDPEFGFLWDITNCFRNQWINRIKQQSEMRKEYLNLLRVPIHTIQESYLKNENYIDEFLNQPHWTWTTTPFDIPDILKPLVGQTSYYF